MRLVIRGKTKKLDHKLSVAARLASVENHSVKAYSMLPNKALGLILGFAAFDEKSMEDSRKRWSCEFVKRTIGAIDRFGYFRWAVYLRSVFRSLLLLHTTRYARRIPSSRYTGLRTSVNRDGN